MTAAVTGAAAGAGVAAAVAGAGAGVDVPAAFADVGAGAGAGVAVDAVRGVLAVFAGVCCANALLDNADISIAVTQTRLTLFISEPLAVYRSIR